jgi:dienelactone hydrolase
MLSASAFAALGPAFASHGWVFFGPYRRGQGLSATAGPYIGDQIAAAQKSGGDSAAAAVMVHLLETDHLDDQLAALAWLRKQDFVQPDRIAVAGTSFGALRPCWAQNEAATALPLIPREARKVGQMLLSCKHS